MRSVLFVTRNFPPEAGPGVHRSIKFVRYLPKNGWRPIVLTGQPRLDVWSEDRSLLEEIPKEAVVIRSLPPSPAASLGAVYSFIRWGTRLARKMAPHWDEKWLLAQLAWISNTALRKPLPWEWGSKAFEMGVEAYDKYRCQAIFSTSPPIETHLVAFQLSKALASSWVADLRDPLVCDPTWHSRSFRYKLLHRRMEKMIISRASAVINLTELTTKDILQRHPISYRAAERFHTIHNGYDLADFLSTAHEPPKKYPLKLLHIGTLYEDCDISGLVKAMSALMQECNQMIPNMLFEFYGSVGNHLRDKSEAKGMPNFQYKGTVPHRDVPNLMAKGHVLLLVSPRNARSIVPGKLYEYLASGRPILYLGPTEGACSDIIREVNAGIVVDNKDVLGIKNAVRNLWDLHRKNRLNEYGNRTPPKKFQRQEQAKQLAEIFATVAENHSSN